MKPLKNMIIESLISEEVDAKKIKELEAKLDKVEKIADEATDKAEKAEKAADEADKKSKDAAASIKSEKDFRDYARNKFEKVFGDDVDEDKMKEIVDGLISKNKEAVEKGDWGKIVGMLNKSFG